MGSRSETVLVTGAAGFIGSHLVEALVGRGQRVIGVDNFDPFYDVGIKRANVSELERACGDGFAFRTLELTDDAQVRSLLEEVRPGGIVHLAAKAGVRPSIEDPVGYGRANVLATSLLLDGAARVGVERFVVASSSSVYGNNKKVPFAETDAVDHPISPYAATKRACELIAHAHAHLTGMPTACLRFFTVYGPRQRPDLAIGRFMRSISAGESITMFGDGASSRDYTYVDDIVRGTVAALDRIDEHGYRIWNLGGSEPVTLAEMIRAIEHVLGREATVERAPMQPGDVDRTYADLERSEAELGYEPAVSFDEGLARQWAWMSERVTARGS